MNIYVVLGNMKRKMDVKSSENDDIDDIMQNRIANNIWRLTTTLCVLVIFSFVSGYLHVPTLIPFLLCCYAMWIWKLKLTYLLDCFTFEHEFRNHRQKAFEQPETLEWFNYLINRWWFFSDRTLYFVLKKSIDPILEASKPKILKSIELEDFTLGDKTPFFKNIEVLDMVQDWHTQNVTDIIYRNPPEDVPNRPKYQVAIHVDMVLDAPKSKMMVRSKLLSNLAKVDISIEHFQISGRLQIILYFNKCTSLPHIAAFQLSFLRSPAVDFKITLEENESLMEFPAIKKWIQDLVDEYLKVSMVSPGHVTIPLCDDLEVRGRQGGHACGALMLEIKGNFNENIRNSKHWYSIKLEKYKIRTKDKRGDSEESVSLLIKNLQYETLRIRVKGKRVLGPTITYEEFVVPLISLNLKSKCSLNMKLESENNIENFLNVNFQYEELPIVNILNENDEYEKSYFEKHSRESPESNCGVLFVCVHEGKNLIAMDPTELSDPYVTIYSNRELVHKGSFLKQTTNPKWNTIAEFITCDYAKTTLSFLVHDYDCKVMAALNNDDFMGSCNLALTEKDWCIHRKEVDLFFKFHGNVSKGQQDCLNRVGTLTISVVFRAIPTLQSSIQPIPNAKIPEGESLDHRILKIDAKTMNAMLCIERGCLSVKIIRARNLVAMDFNGLSDPFVIISVANTRQRKYKSQMIPCTLNPVWNEKATFPMIQKHESLIFTVWDKDPFTNDYMGEVRLHYNDLILLGKERIDNPIWFSLDKAKSGEIQLAFKVDKTEQFEDPNNNLLQDYTDFVVI